ncbi:hypothetical protein JG687_00004508 [Phytophthora cactorum]|uniref:Uncharacterized protein n=1 Tax=Phytophthora cactorum TaxID=29920 RepID=A0A8T1UT38_9STRA|nr:hypothetical protein JG687_00004508 [Phytophthora cactorum]
MKTATTTVYILTLFVLTEAGYVDLFKDADFKNKRARVKDVVVDVCYTFKCEYGDSLDNSITSAKWHGLPEHGAFFRDGDAIINFYTGLDCKGEHESWLIKTQSKKLYFPENFRLDGINDAISSFKHHNILAMATVLLVTTVQAGYVDLYKDADYKNKLVRVYDVEVDNCYSFACDALDNTITSARWGGLPEKTSKGDDTMISFYVDRDCREHDIWWRTKTQSDDDLYFPSNFKLDGINDQISSFMVWDTKKILGSWAECAFPDYENLDASGTSFAVIGASITPEPFSGDIEFYRDVNSKHILGTMKINVANRCYNLDCGNLNDNISSVTWSGLPE